MKSILLYSVMLFFTVLVFALFGKNVAKLTILLAVIWGDYLVLQWMLWRKEQR